jgi:hypothetical protein
MKIRLMFLAFAAVLIPDFARAVVITASDSGFVTEMGGSSKGDATLAPSAKYNYSVGFEEHYATGDLGPTFAPMFRRNYFVFDLTGVATITSGTLTLWAGTYESGDATESFGLFDSTDPAGAKGLATALLTGTSTSDFDDPGDPLVGAAATLYTKLADGPMFLGGLVISAAADDSYIDIAFTSAGLGYLNTFLGTSVILGGKVPTAVPPSFPQQPFGFTGPDIPGGDPKTPKLTLSTIPEPSAGLLVLAGGALAFSRRRGKSTA